MCSIHLYKCHLCGWVEHIPRVARGNDGLESRSIGGRGREMNVESEGVNRLRLCAIRSTRHYVIYTEHTPLGAPPVSASASGGTRHSANRVLGARPLNERAACLGRLRSTTAHAAGSGEDQRSEERGGGDWPPRIRSFGFSLSACGRYAAVRRVCVCVCARWNCVGEYMYVCAVPVCARARRACVGSGEWGGGVCVCV